MGKSWIDVHAGHWFYNDIIEITNYYLEDGEPLVSGMTYSVMESPRIYEEFKASGQASFTLSQAPNPTPDNPLYVFIDGVQSVYKSIQGNTVNLYAAPRIGATVVFFQPGKPKVDTNGRPVSGSGSYVYPSYTLNFGGNSNLEYYYNPFNIKYLEYLYAFGRALRRANVQLEEWLTQDPQVLARKYIGFADDVYAVNPYTATVYVPFSLNGVSLEFVYTARDKVTGEYKMMRGTVKATSPSVVYTDRFFPNAKITRAEAIAMLDRLRQSFYHRFTDANPPRGSFHDTQIAYTGQRVFYTNGVFDESGEGLTVMVDGALLSKEEYRIVDDHTILLNQPLVDGQVVDFIFTVTKSKFIDVSNTDWFFPYVVGLEREYIKTPNGRRWLLTGRVAKEDFNVLYPNEFLTRAEAVALLNRFREWAIQTFKL